MHKPLIERLIVYLLPYFVAITEDIAAARDEILATIESYGPRTRAEYLHATRAIVLSMASMDILGEAKLHVELSTPLRQRHHTTAATLARAAQADEKALQRRLKQPVPVHQPPPDEPNDAEVEAALAEAQHILQKAQRRATGTHDAQPPQTLYALKIPAAFALPLSDQPRHARQSWPDPSP